MRALVVMVELRVELARAVTGARVDVRFQLHPVVEIRALGMYGLVRYAPIPIQNMKMRPMMRPAYAP